MIASPSSQLSGAGGPVILLGSGETAPSAQKIFHQIFATLADRGEKVRLAILETPAGFEPNSGYVAEQVALFVKKRLQNFAPAVTIIPARKRGTAYSPDDPALAAQLHDASVIFMGPGSPTYAVRQLRQSLVWETARACQRQGAALMLSSAATLAASRWTLPVYEIYKAGADLYWQPGLDFFADFGLSLLLVSHWNNSDGGATFDTSRCYIGQERFAALLDMIPDPPSAYTLVGLDENTALTLDPDARLCTVIGVGEITVIRQGETLRYAAGEEFPVQKLGDFQPLQGPAAIDSQLWQTVATAREDAARARAALPQPDAQVLTLLDLRAAARADQNWAESDQLRTEIARLGWRVLDTATEQQLEPL